MLLLLRVLLAEDHPAMREAVTALLSQHCEVIGSVGRGDAVVEAVHRLLPDLLVMDISMPGHSGFHVLSELRKEGQSLPIVLLSSHDSQPYRNAAYARGANGYVTKSSASTQLWPAIQAAVAGRNMMQAKRQAR